MNYAHKALGAHTFRAKILEKNAPSIALFRKMDFLQMNMEPNCFKEYVFERYFQGSGKTDFHVPDSRQISESFSTTMGNCLLDPTPMESRQQSRISETFSTTLGKCLQSPTPMESRQQSETFSTTMGKCFAESRQISKAFQTSSDEEPATPENPANPDSNAMTYLSMTAEIMENSEHHKSLAQQAYMHAQKQEEEFRIYQRTLEEDINHELSKPWPPQVPAVSYQEYVARLGQDGTLRASQPQN